MKSRQELRALLRSLEKRYLRSGTRPEIQRYLAKLCVLEACGWIEEVLDLFYLHHSNRLLIEPGNRKSVMVRVKKIYSFEYDKPVRSVVECLVGLRGVESFERTVDPHCFVPMVAALSALKLSRNALAHTHIPGAQAVVDAPSLTISRFGQVERGLRHCNVVFQRIT